MVLMVFQGSGWRGRTLDGSIIFGRCPQLSPTILIEVIGHVPALQ